MKGGSCTHRWSPCRGDVPEDVCQSKPSRKLQPGLALPLPYFVEAVEALQAVSCQLRGMGQGQRGSRRKDSGAAGEGYFCDWVARLFPAL